MCGYHVCCHVLLLFFITFSSSVSFMHSQASLLFLPLCPVLHLLLLLLCPVLLCSRAAPSPSSSLHSLTCLGTAVTKSLRKRRILHRFSLGPGTPLQRVCVCVCVFVWVCVCAHASLPFSLHCRLTTNGGLQTLQCWRFAEESRLSVTHITLLPRPWFDHPGFYLVCTLSVSPECSTNELTGLNLFNLRCDLFPCQEMDKYTLWKTCTHWA